MIRTFILLACLVMTGYAAPDITVLSPPSSEMHTAEFTVRDGLWTDTEVPLSAATIEMIRQTEAGVAHEEPVEQLPTIEIATSAAETHATAETETETEMHTTAEDDTDITDDIDMEIAQAVMPDGLWSDAIPANHPTEQLPQDAFDTAAPDTETEATETDTETATEDELEIAAGGHGRMILIPHSPSLRMHPILAQLRRLIGLMKARTPSLARMTLTLRVEPVTLPRRAIPIRGVRPIAIRLMPSRPDIRTRRALARCGMLLRQALSKLRKQMRARGYAHRRMMMMPRMTRAQRMMAFTRLLDRISHSPIGITNNTLTLSDHSHRRLSLGNIEVEAEGNGTASMYSPRLNLNARGSVVVLNRGTLIILNRSANTTLAVTSSGNPTPPTPTPSPTPAPAQGEMRHRFRSLVSIPVLTMETNAATPTTSTSTDQEN